MSKLVSGIFEIKDPDQFLYICDGLDFVTTIARNIKKDDIFKLDGTQKSVYIAEEDYYNTTISVTKICL